jgi:hypothetical protein
MHRLKSRGHSLGKKIDGVGSCFSRKDAMQKDPFGLARRNDPIIFCFCNTCYAGKRYFRLELLDFLFEHLVHIPRNKILEIAPKPGQFPHDAGVQIGVFLMRH